MLPVSNGKSFLLHDEIRPFLFAHCLHISQIFRGDLGCFGAREKAADARDDEAATILVRPSKQRVGSSSLSGRALVSCNIGIWRNR